MNIELLLTFEFSINSAAVITLKTLAAGFVLEAGRPESRPGCVVARLGRQRQLQLYFSQWRAAFRRWF